MRRTVYVHHDHHVGAYIDAHHGGRHALTNYGVPCCLQCRLFVPQLFTAFDLDGPYRICPACYRIAASENFKKDAREPAGRNEVAGAGAHHRPRAPEVPRRQEGVNTAPTSTDS